MRKLLLASYQFRTGEATHKDLIMLSIFSRVNHTDQDDVKEGYRVFDKWFGSVYTESELINCIIKVTVSENTTFPVVESSPAVPLIDIFSSTSVYYLKQMGITDSQQAAALSDENLLRVYGIGLKAIERLRNLHR